MASTTVIQESAKLSYGLIINKTNLEMAVCEKKYDTVVGSWFNSGFHGHFRSVPRNYYNTFREISKPTPPRKFSARLQEGSFSNSFTRHDNRKTFTDDIDQLAQNGLKKDPSRTSRFNSKFIAWDKKQDPRHYMSCYRVDSRSNPVNFHVRDCMKDWGPLGAKMELNTMYREHYCRQPPVTHELRTKITSSPMTTEHVRPKSAAQSRDQGDRTPEVRYKKRRPHTSNLVPLPPLVTRDRQMRPEWMGNSLLKQRNQSEIVLTDQTNRSDTISNGSGRSWYSEIRDQGTNTDLDRTTSGNIELERAEQATNTE